jgi:PKD repeat protein
MKPSPRGPLAFVFGMCAALAAALPGELPAQPPQPTLVASRVYFNGGPPQQPSGSCSDGSPYGNLYGQPELPSPAPRQRVYPEIDYSVTASTPVDLDIEFVLDGQVLFNGPYTLSQQQPGGWTLAFACWNWTATTGTHVLTGRVDPNNRLSDDSPSKTTSYSFSVGLPPNADFTWVPPNPSVGDKVQFFDASTSNPTSWSWVACDLGSFCPESTPSDQNPSFCPTSPGECPVTLTASNQYGSSQTTHTLVVASPATISVSDSHDRREIVIPDALLLTAAHTGCVPVDAQWAWNLDGGYSNYQSGATTEVGWTAPGTYTVTVQNPACGNAQGTYPVIVHLPPALTAPGSPTNLSATPSGPGTITLTWNEASANVDGYSIEESNQYTGQTTILYAPPPSSSGSTSGPVSVALTNLLPVALHSFQVAAHNAAAASGLSNEARTLGPPFPCVDSETTVCLPKTGAGAGTRTPQQAAARYQVQVLSYSPDGTTAFPGVLTPLTPSSAYASFGNALTEADVLVRLEDGCPAGGKPLVLIGGTSTLKTLVTVLDTLTGEFKSYSSPAGALTTPVRDGSSFPCAGAPAAAPFEQMDVLNVSRTEAAQAPSVTYGPQPPLVGGPITFYSGLPSGVSTTWDFGDGMRATQNEPSITHSYSAPGNYTVKSAALYEYGVGPEAAPVTVAVFPNSPPSYQLAIRGPSTATIGTSVVFSAVGNCKPDPLGWKWNVGGGTIQGPTNASAVSVAWAASGVQTVTASNKSCPGASVSPLAVRLRPPTTASCTPGRKVLCLVGGRFQVSARYSTSPGVPPSRNASVVSLNDSTGYFVLNPQGVDPDVQVHIGSLCTGRTGNYLIEAGGSSNLRLKLTVTDTKTGVTKTYPRAANRPLVDSTTFHCP